MARLSFVLGFTFSFVGIASAVDICGYMKDEDNRDLVINCFEEHLPDREQSILRECVQLLGRIHPRSVLDAYCESEEFMRRVDDCMEETARSETRLEDKFVGGSEGRQLSSSETDDEDELGSGSGDGEGGSEGRHLSSSETDDEDELGSSSGDGQGYGDGFVTDDEDELGSGEPGSGDRTERSAEDFSEESEEAYGHKSVVYFQQCVRNIGSEESYEDYEENSDDESDSDEDDYSYYFDDDDDEEFAVNDRENHINFAIHIN